MLEFHDITPESAGQLRKYYERCNYGLCEYSVGIKLMWKHYLHPVYTEASGCLIVRNRIHGAYTFDYPVAGPDGNIEAALTEIERDCMDRGMELTFSVVPESAITNIIGRYPYMHISNVGAWKDYIYAVQDLSSFSGRHYAGQRNHIHKFQKYYPEAFFRPLTGQDRESIEAFWREFEHTFSKSSNQSALTELGYAEELFRQYDKPWFCCGGVEYGGKLIAIALGEYCGDTLLIHIEKGLREYPGVYPYIVNQFAQHFQSPQLRYINREDDASDAGLRVSKRQYLPIGRGAKYRFHIYTELDQMTERPILHSEHLQYSFQEQTNQADNIQPKDLSKTYEPAKKSSVCFTVRQGLRPIASCTLSHFDFRGGVELSFNIQELQGDWPLLEEAVATVANWALYQLHLDVIRTKCPQSEKGWYNILNNCFHLIGTDDAFFYFEKQI